MFPQEVAVSKRRRVQPRVVLLLVEVFGESASHVRERWSVAEGAREENREIAYVDEELVPEVREELLAREPRSGEGGVGQWCLRSMTERRRSRMPADTDDILASPTEAVIFFASALVLWLLWPRKEASGASREKLRSPEKSFLTAWAVCRAT